MRKKRVVIGKSAIMVCAFSLLLITAFGVEHAFAQNSGDGAQVRERAEIRSTEQEARGDQLHRRIRDRIENEEGLQDQERERLRQHLGECNQLGLNDEVLAALFSEEEPLQKQIRTQERVLAMAREGIPVEPLAQKIQEGRRKGAGEQAMERVCNRMEEHLRTSHRFMLRLREDGIESGNPEAERRHTREMAMHMWHGLEEGDMEQLRERARLRQRDGSCTTEDLTVAAETATQIKEMGIERQRAVKLTGEALQNGYNTREMRQLGWMIMTAYMHGGPPEDVVDTVEDGIRHRHQLSQMMQQMWQQGWMGPADQHGGHGPMDGAPGSGPGGQQGGQDKEHGGSGGHGKGGGGQ